MRAQQHLFPLALITLLCALFSTACERLRVKASGLGLCQASQQLALEKAKRLERP